MRRSVLPAIVCLVLAANGFGEDYRAPDRPAVAIHWDGNAADAVSGTGPVRPAAPALEEGKMGGAARIAGEPLVYSSPKGFDWERGTVELWIRPDFDFADDAYHTFFDTQQVAKGHIYLIKSGAGGANGLFLCVVDEKGQWLSAAASAGGGYSWKPGEWHHLAGAWDGQHGWLALFFDGRKVAECKVSPFRIGTVGDTFAVGGSVKGDQVSPGRVDEFRLYRDTVTNAPLAAALNCEGGEHSAWRAIDGDTGDDAAWHGAGCPNWIEIELPAAVSLARVIAHPGDRRYWGNPSTECSPREFIVEGWVGEAWQPLSALVTVPRYAGAEGAHCVVADLSPTVTKRFRIRVTSLYDEGKRVSSPDGPIVPPEERSIVIREIEWQTEQQIAEARLRLAKAKTETSAEIAFWQGAFAKSGPVAKALRVLYGGALVDVEKELAALSDRDAERLEAILARWQRVRTWLEPWRSCASSASTGGQGDVVGWVEMEVGPGETPHQSYPASVPLDLRILEALLGQPVDPYTVRVADLSDGQRPCPCRLDRVTPDRGALTWTMKDRAHTRFLAQFLRRPPGPPAEGMCTLGNCDQFYFAESKEESLPWNLWSAAFVDWDGDGKQDLIAGRWTDYCHFWKNVGSRSEMKFVEREHWLVVDSTDDPIVFKREHPGLGFSMAYPVDFDGDGRLDLFFTNYYGTPPTFYRNVGPASFPIVAPGKKPIGLTSGKIAFGDLTGDGMPDAVVVKRGTDKDEVVLHAGKGLSPDGRPMFGEGAPLGVEVHRSLIEHARTCPALADMDADGDLDLFLCGPPYLWQYENTGSPKTFRFGPGKKVERAGKPLDLGCYYTFVNWADVDGDGDLDLIKCTGLSVYLNEGDARQLRLGKVIQPTVAGQRAMGRSGLKSFEMVDWDGDGDLDRVRTADRGTDLSVDEFQDGLFRRSFTVEVDPNKLDWYGCPDTTEYYSLYANLKLVDWDGDGDRDVFITSEHSWRFGYIHYYENMGAGKFGSEVKLRLDPTCDYVRFVPGKSGQAALVDGKTFVDFLSYPTSGSFAPEGGTIRFWFRPNWNADDGAVRYFFYTGQNPATYGISPRDLHEYYVGIKPDLGLRPPFALLKTAKGALCLQTWTQTLETKALDWKEGEWHLVEASWGATGRAISLDGARVAEDREAVKVAPCGRQVFIGCNSVMLVQREREYPGRWKEHPIERVFPADGAFDDFEVRDASGKALLTLPFDGNCNSLQGESGDRMKIGYRCTPGFADLNGDGLLDMVMMVADGRRGAGAKEDQRSWGTGQLFLYPNIGTKTQPRLGEGILLTHTDGRPFRCHIRTQITCADWDRDGRVDLILSTENCEAAELNRTVDLFRNMGTRERPAFGPREPMDRLNELIQAHHDVKLAAVDLTGDGVLDVVTSTDPGTRVTYRSFLDEAPVAVHFVRVGVGPGAKTP